MGLRLLAVAFLVGAAFAGPLQRESQCATRCPSSSDNKFNYQPGKKYVYDYQGVNHVVVAGQRKQKAQITAHVEIHVQSKCELVLKMKNIRIEHKATQAETADLIRQLDMPLPFAFEDGNIEHVCPSAEETKQSQNIKKAVLSAFINTMDNLEESQEVKEVDSLGTCKTKYTVQRGRQTIIEKQKDLKSCTNRHSSITSLMTNQYESPESDFHTLPVFPQEKLTCQEVFEDRILKSAHCKELSKIQPLSERDSIIELEGKMELKLIRVESSENMRLPSDRVRESILFNMEEESMVEDKEREVEDRLREMCSKNAETIDLSVSKDFIELVAAVKRQTYESLHRIYQSLESGSLCSSKKLTDLFLDTLPMAGNDAAIKLMVKLLLEQKVSGLKAKLWTASLALVSHPTQEAIAAVVPLVRQQKSASVLLGVSAMVYRYCSHSECENNNSVKEIVSSLSEVLGRQCAFDNENEAIAVLKAFGNMGQLLQAEQTILACAQDSDKNIRVRLAAIDAFRRVNKKKPEALLRLYTNTQEHFEVRIAALSSVLRQADRRQVQSIKQVAEHESDEQVSAYAGTLIDNLNKTSCPLKKHVRQLLNEIRIQTSNPSYWDNSKNIELSTFSEPLNIGGAVEADVIHAPNTKVPRSIYARFDLDVLDKHLNIFEIGMRAEGLEAAFKKLIGFQEAKKQRSSWNILRSSSETEEDKVQASLFFRTMNTEIFDLSVDDFTGMGEMIKIADVLNKISHDKSADFSHSFMFMNSKIIIPSVTGRSYSFGLIGSATVGLTASSKIDIVNIMSKPKNADIHGHFQPSVNVEIAATVGIHSDKHRPDVKIITRLHSESDIEAQFRIKDGHLGLIKVSMPSENIVLTRISSDIVEIDADHQEKRIYEKMQNKVDYCFDKLEKPLGVSICGKWEVPRPFMSKTFPFVKGVGNVELSIKKADSEMKGYELSFEIPKHQSQQMKYRAVLDTPGSRIHRRFSADLEVRMPSRDQKEFSLQLQSPFQSARASASGSFTMQKDLIEGSIDVQAGDSRRYSIKASSPISESGAQKIYRPSIQVSSHSSQPLKVDGIVTVTKGRKQQISFDIKSNKPSGKPLLIKGSIVKDGRLSFSKNAEWKLSSDVALKTPILNLQIRSSTEKQAKQAQTVSTALTVDYQKERSQRQSVKLTAKVQNRSSKISSIAQFETTEYPAANLIFTWNTQGKLRESLKNEISLKYGRNPERQYINILQSSSVHESQPGEVKIAVKAPQFNIDSDISISHDIQKNSRVHADVDLRYKADKHIRAKLQLDNLSERPLKLKVKAELQTPSRRIMYQDELEEIDRNSYKGNAILEWRADKKAEIQYKYQKKSDGTKLHHEIETTLRLPNSRSPIKNRASFQMSPEHVGIEGRLSLDRTSEYSLKAHLNKKGTSHVSLKMPKAEGNLKLVNEQDKKAADLDLKVNLSRRPRHIIASASLGLGAQKKIEAEIALDADNKPNQKFLISSTYEKRPRNQFSVTSQMQVSDKASISISASGDAAIKGKHEASVQASLLRFEPVGIEIEHEMRSSKIQSTIRISKSQKPKLELTIEGENSKTGREYHLSTSASLKSLDNSFQTKKWGTEQTFARSGSSATLKSKVVLEWSPSKMYKSEISYDFQPNVVQMKAYLHTPHQKYEKQSVGFSFRKSESIFASSATIELPSGKSISLTSETEKMANSLKSTLAIRSPFESLKDASAQLSWRNQETQKSLESSVDVNGERLAEAELSMKSSSSETEIKVRGKTSRTSEVSARITIEKNRQSLKYDVQVMRDSSTLMSVTVSKKVSSKEYSYVLQSKSQEKTLVNLKLFKEVSEESTKHTMEVEGPFPHVSLSIESARKDQKSLSIGIQACQKSESRTCYSVKAYHTSLINEEHYRYYRKITLDIEKSYANSSPEHIAKVNIVASIKGNEYREKFIVETKEKKLGYEVKLHMKENEHDHCTLDAQIYMPQRTVRVTGSAVHSKRSIQMDFEIVPDTSVPTRKLGFEMKMEEGNKEVSGYVKILYPGMRKAFKLSGRIQNEGYFPVEGKLTLDASAVGGKVLVLEIVPEQQSGRQERRSIQYMLYTEDKKVDISAKLTKHVTREESEFAYEWSWKTQQRQQEGKLSLRLSKNRNGKPQALEIEMASQGVSSKLNSQITWGSRTPSAVHLSFESSNEKLVEINIKSEENCLVVEERLRSKQFMTNSICFGKQEQDKFKLIQVETYYQRRPCVQFEIEIDQHEPHFTNLNLKWDRRNFQLALDEVRQVLSQVQSRYISDVDFQAIKQTLRQIRQNARQAVHDAKQKLQEIYERHFQTLKQHLINAKHFSISEIWEQLARHIPVEYIQTEIVQPFIETSICIWSKYVAYARTHVLYWIRTVWEETKRNAVECMKSYCPKDSLCYELATLLEHFEVEQAKMLFSRRVSSAKRSLSKQLERVQMPNVQEWIERISQAVREQWRAVFGNIFEGRLVESFINYAKKMECYAMEVLSHRFEKFVEWVMHTIKHAEKDEDFRVLKFLVEETKEKAIHTWKNRDIVIENTWKPLKESLFEDYPKKWVEERMTIHAFAPKEGNIEIQLHHPLQRKYIQVLQNAFLAMKNKIFSDK